MHSNLVHKKLHAQTYAFKNHDGGVCSMTMWKMAIVFMILTFLFRWVM